MKWVTSHSGVLHVRESRDAADGASIDATAAAPRLEPRAVHELLFEAPLSPAWLALLWARDAAPADRPIVWIDAAGTFYPPAAVAAGVAMNRLCLIRPTSPDQAAVIAADCLRCRGVGAVVAPVPTRLSRVETRRLQLAAEQGGGVGLLLRPRGRGDDVYAAATRWLVAPSPAIERATQRFRVELLHGHGRPIRTFFVESSRARIDQLRDVPPVPADSGVRVRAAAELADRPPREASA